ncbi:hypothetical protein H2200_011509 [Cladophialophora chaetospira]|uniref:Uncharacterized protein n=1 Tax=Cladophialophora chaetospira TaxID=386627 RepID=A0AA38WZG0_9EURO|nr:hypothetical protein H2200_011509 [Cladophialophora chaetospira]
MSMRYFFEPDRNAVTVGSVVEAQPALPPLEAHIFLKDKAAYLVLAEDGARKNEEFGSDFSGKLEQWKADRQKSGQSSL